MYHLHNMSFFDKFFSNKTVSYKNENELKAGADPLRSTNFLINKEQIRFVLFRECDRRGRKLLFDSNAVEKVPLDTNSVCERKCQEQSNRKNLYFIETTAAYGYRFKKLSRDVASLGEMIFGSVAMIYKGENCCKIHKIPSPKQLMFTTIVHAPNRCPGTYSENSFDSSFSCTPNNNNNNNNHHHHHQKEVSSDSKLYRQEVFIQKCSSTYPYIESDSLLHKVKSCDVTLSKDRSKDEKCSKSGSDVTDVTKNFFLCHENDEIETSGIKKNEKISLEKYALEIFGCPAKSNELEGESSSNLDSAVPSISSLECENVSCDSSGSLSSLRRRWAQSCSTSLDITASEETNNSPCRRRAKLGMAILLHLGDSNDNDLENFLYNHTILLDNIMGKLQSSIEEAYIRNQNFIDLTHLAFLEAQSSIYELITGGNYVVPLWISLLGDQDGDVELSTREISLSGRRKKANNKDFPYSFKLKFLNEFRDVLVKFDTKDTNFFISTLLTAVLTHHLSWVNAIAETDMYDGRKMQSVIRNYNPIWAQLNDLYGLLGSPLKCARTVITGAETKKCYIKAILQVLTYFVRCYNVVENIYDVNIDIEDRVEKTLDEEKVDSESGVPVETTPDIITDNSSRPSVIHQSVLDCAFTHLIKTKQKPEKNSNVLEFYAKGSGNMKRNKSCLSQLNKENPSLSNDLNQNINHSQVTENIDDINSTFNDNLSFRNDIDIKEKVQNTLPDERLVSGLFTLKSHDFTDSADSFRKRDEANSCETSNVNSSKENIVFILGENDKLMNLQKTKITKPDIIHLNKEDYKKSGVEVDSCQSANTNISVNEKENWTLNEFNDGNIGEMPLAVSRDNVESSQDKFEVINYLQEIEMPPNSHPIKRKQIEVSSVFGGVNKKYNSEQILQGVTEAKAKWESTLQKDLFLCAYNSTVEKNVSEALCIIGDIDSWEVLVYSSTSSVLNRNKHTAVRVGMSQLVADMLESFLCLHKINLSPTFCLIHIEQKLREIYLKSKTVAELLNSTELCSIDYLTTSLDVGINDIPLLLSVATTHSPHISEKYGLSFT